MKKKEARRGYCRSRRYLEQVCLLRLFGHDWLARRHKFEDAKHAQVTQVIPHTFHAAVSKPRADEAPENVNGSKSNGAGHKGEEYPSQSLEILGLEDFPRHHEQVATAANHNAKLVDSARGNDFVLVHVEDGSIRQSHDAVGEDAALWNSLEFDEAIEEEGDGDTRGQRGVQQQPVQVAVAGCCLFALHQVHTVGDKARRHHDGVCAERQGVRKAAQRGLAQAGNVPGAPQSNKDRSHPRRHQANLTEAKRPQLVHLVDSTRAVACRRAFGVGRAAEVRRCGDVTVVQHQLWHRGVQVMLLVPEFGGQHLRRKRASLLSD
eukprot:m.221300 g.221300  ORF g.221300 m.221300 type:complete len:320 (-) comp22286_c0_seq7:638-1597(-)